MNDLGPFLPSKFRANQWVELTRLADAAKSAKYSKMEGIWGFQSPTIREERWRSDIDLKLIRLEGNQKSLEEAKKNIESFNKKSP